MNISKFSELFIQRQKDTGRSKDFWVGENTKLSYGELFDKISQTSSFIHQLNLSTNDRIAICSDDFLSVIIIFFAMLRNGITVVFLDPHSTWNEAKVLIKTADVSAIFLDAVLEDKYQLTEIISDDTPIIPIVPGYQKKKTISKLFRKKATPSEKFPALLESYDTQDDYPLDLPEDTVAYILFTSGTTSQPKGVEITHKNLYAQECTFVKQYGMDANTQLLNVLPLFHTDGLTHGPVLAFQCGATIHRPVRFTLDYLPILLDSIYKKRITHYITVPAVLTLMQHLGDEYKDCFDTPDFKFLISTAALLDPGLWHDIESYFKVLIVNVYGLTETVCEAIYCGPSDETRKLGTIGKPIDCEARIVDANGNDVSSGVTGELLLRGDHIMKGYFRQPKETSKVLSADGWFSTGDLASVDNEGFYSIVGRKKNVIITAGINVYPEDVDHVLRSMPEIIDAVTFGLEDETWGERVISCVVPKPGAELTIELVASYCANNLAREKLPNKIHILEELPRGPAGKVLLKEVKGIARSLDTTILSRNINDDLTHQVFQVAAQIFKMPVEEISLDSNPDNTLGWSSLAHVELLVGLENTFDIKMAPKDIMNMKTLKDTISIIDQKLTATSK